VSSSEYPFCGFSLAKLFPTQTPFSMAGRRSPDRSLRSWEPNPRRAGLNCGLLPSPKAYRLASRKARRPSSCASLMGTCSRTHPLERLKAKNIIDDSVNPGASSISWKARLRGPDALGVGLSLGGDLASSNAGGDRPLWDRGMAVARDAL